MPTTPEPTVPGQHNFVTKLKRLIEEGKVMPGYSTVDVAHDEWCAYSHGEVCNCDPDIRVRPMATNN